MKLYAARIWTQNPADYNDGRWIDSGYHYSLRPWSYDTNLDDRPDGYLIEPQYTLDLSKEDLENYFIEESNTPKDARPLVRFGGRVRRGVRTPQVHLWEG